MTRRQSAESGPTRVALATWGISHFEVPMFRLLESAPSVDLRVFYLLDPSKNLEYDADYGQGIGWGESMLGGYQSTLCSDPRDLRARVFRWRPDAVMVYGYSWPGALLLIAGFRARGVPVILRGPLSGRVDPRGGRRARIARRLRWAVFHCFRSLHYGGTESYNVLRSAGIAPRRLFFVPYSVDSRFFAAAAEKGGDGGRGRFLEDRGWPSDSKVALFIGQLSWVKGPDIALEAFRLWSDRDPLARLVVIGNGSQASVVRQAVEALRNPAHVHLAGFCPSKETPAYYLRSDVVIFTSRYETWARAVNEAMLCQRACIVNDRIAACGGLVQDGVTGIVLSELDPGAYAKALERFFDLPVNSRGEMGKAAQARAFEFSYEAHERELLDSIHFAAGQGRGSAPGEVG